MNLQNCDCLEFLKTLDDESVDLIIADPPYFEIVKDSWDHQWLNETHYLEWCHEWTKEACRVLRMGRCLYVWGTTKHDTFLKYKLEVLNDMPEMVYRSWLIWSSNWGGRTKKNFARKHEDLLMYSKGDPFLFNADAVRIPYKMKKNVRAGSANNPLGTIPTDVW